MFCELDLNPEYLKTRSPRFEVNADDEDMEYWTLRFQTSGYEVVEIHVSKDQLENLGDLIQHQLKGYNMVYGEDFQAYFNFRFFYPNALAGLAFLKPEE